MFCLCAKELDGIRVRSGNPAENVEVNMSTFPAGKEMKMQKDEKGVAVVIHLLWNFLILPERCDVNIFASSSSGNGVCRCKAHLVAVRLSNDRLNHRRRDAEFRAPKPKCVMSPSHPVPHAEARVHRVPQSSTCPCSFPDGAITSVWNQNVRIAHIAGVLRSLIPDADQLMQAKISTDSDSVNSV